MTWTPWLADIAIKSSALLLLALLVNRLALRRAPAAVRHAVWILALVSSLAAPALTALLPRWHVPLLRVAAIPALPADTAADPASIIAASSQPVAPGALAPRAEADTAIAGAPAAGAGQDPAGRPPVTASRLTTRSQGDEPSRLADWSSVSSALWLLVAGLLIVRQLIATVRAARLSRRARTPGRAPWMTTARRLARSVGAPAGTRFLRSEAIGMPIACGVLKPTVVLPAEADCWPDARVRAVLLHELAHVRRRDCLTQAVADAACAVFWFNPLAWLAARELRRERERACDDMVLAAGMPGPDYAAHLLEVARAMRGASRGAVFSSGVAMAHRSELEGRLMAILDDARPRRALTARGLALAAFLSLTLVVPLAAMNPWVNDTQEAWQSASQPSAATATAQPTREPQAVQPERGRGAAVATSESSADSVSSGRSTSEGVRGGIAGGVADGIVGGVANGVVGGVLHGIGGGVVNPHVATSVAARVSALAGEIAWAVQEAPGKPKIAVEDKQPRKPADPKMVAALAEAMKDSDAEVRQAAIGALAELRDGSTFDAMVLALKDKDDEVRQRAAFALGQMRDKRAVPALQSVLSDANPEVRQQAVFGLGQLRDVSTIDALSTALKDSDAEVRQQAAFALGQLRDARAVPALITMLQDKDEEVRQQAAFALGQIRDPKAVDGLLIAIKDANAEVRQQSLHALSQIGDPRAADAAMAALKDPDPEVRQMAAHALGQLLRAR